MRKLLVTNREFESGCDEAACNVAWDRVRSAVEAVGGRAWRFHDSARPSRIVEFIEWIEPSDPLCDAEVNRSLSGLSAIAPSVTEQLLEEH